MCPPVPMVRSLILAGLSVLVLAAAPTSARALEDPPAVTSAWDPTVAPLRATVSAAVYAPLPMGATYVIDELDDSPQGRRMERALDAALADLGGRGQASTPLDLSYSVYVIAAGQPEKAASILGPMEPVPPYRWGLADARENGARWGQPVGMPRGIDVTALQGRGAPTGWVLSQDERAFGAVLRLEVTVRDPRDGTPLWTGWADSTTGGLARDQVVSLLAEPVLSTLGQTVAGRSLRLPVPPEWGGRPTAEDGPATE